MLLTKLSRADNTARKAFWAILSPETVQDVIPRRQLVNTNPNLYRSISDRSPHDNERVHDARVAQNRWRHLHFQRPPFHLSISSNYSIAQLLCDSRSTQKAGTRQQDAYLTRLQYCSHHQSFVARQGVSHRKIQLDLPPIAELCDACMRVIPASFPMSI